MIKSFDNEFELLISLKMNFFLKKNRFLDSCIRYYLYHCKRNNSVEFPRTFPLFFSY